MKKLLITMAVLTTMVAGAIAFSSFAAPKEEENANITHVEKNDGWREVGVYTGIRQSGTYNARFRIWEKDGMCNTYYWVFQPSYHTDDFDKDPDKTSCAKGALRQNSNKEWYAALGGDIYIIKDF